MEIPLIIFPLRCRLNFIHWLNSGDPLWRNFPEKLRDKTGASQYVQLFHRPFDDRRLSPVEDAVLKLSLLKAIPPPTPAQTAFVLHLPEEVQELSVSKIIDHVVDLASGYVKLSMYVGPPREVVTHSILPILAEKVGVDLCKLCLSPQRGCTCAPHPPPGPWSQTSAAPQASVMTVTANMTPVTTLSTSYGGPGAAGPTPVAFPPLPEPTKQAPVPSLMHQPRPITSSAFQAPQTTSSLGGTPAAAPPPVRQSGVQTSVRATGAPAYRLPSPMRASLADQGRGRGGVIRSHSASSSESLQTCIGEGTTTRTGTPGSTGWLCTRPGPRSKSPRGVQPQYAQ